MPEIVGRDRPPRLSAAPATPALGEIYYDTTANVLYWWNGTAWVGATGGAAAVPLVSALPGSPVDGQECYYQSSGMATAGTAWHLRYRSGGGTYKWEWLGGPPLWAEVNSFEGTTSTTYVALTTAGPSVTVPLAGEYDVRVEAFITLNSGAVPAVGLMSYQIGATTASDLDSISGGAAATTSPATGFNSSGARRKTIAAASTALAARYRSSASSNQATFDKRRMWVTPARVG